MGVTALDLGKEELAKSNALTLSLGKGCGVCTSLSWEKLDQTLL